MALGKVSGIDWANLASVAGVAKANIAKVAGVEVPAASGAVLDSYTGAGTAYALFQLYSSYTGDCIRVYRDSDGDTLDVGFDGSGDLNTADIESFCSGTTGRVITWYDQSGNGYDMVYVTGTRAIIYESGAVYTVNGTPAVKNVAPGGVLLASSVSGADMVGVNEGYIVVAGAINGQINIGTGPINITLSNSASVVGINGGGSILTYNADITYTAGVQYIGEGLYVDGVTNPDLYVNNSLASEAFGFSGSYTGSGTSSIQGRGHLQVGVIWPVDQTSNRSGIYTAIYNKLNGI